MNQRRASSRLHRTWAAAGALLAAFLFALIITLGATRWLPPGRGGIDHLVVPVVLFPLTWVALALPLHAARRRRLAWGLVGALTAVHAALVVSAFFG